MIFYIVGSVLEAAVSLGDICNKQVLYYALCILVKILRELNFALQNLLINCHWVIVVKGINSSYHFVGQDTQRPPVDRFAVSFI